MNSNDRIVDIKENTLDRDVLSILLVDRTTGENIIWATDDYSSLGADYTFSDNIRLE